MAATKAILRRADVSGIPLLATRLLLGSFFIYMGAMKIGEPVEFLKQIRLFNMLPQNPPYFLNGTAIVLPWVEVVCGVALILGLWIRGAAVAIAAMLCVYTPAIFIRAVAIHNTEGTPFLQIAFDCGCGTGEVIIWKKLLSNTGLLLLCVVGLVLRSRRFSLTMLLDRRRLTASYCRRCGYPVRDAADGLCDNCRESAVVPVGTPELVSRSAKPIPVVRRRMPPGSRPVL